MRQTPRNLMVFVLMGKAVVAQSQSPETTFRVPVRLVTASTLVFSKERHLIPNLKATDFRVFDNGALQKVVLDMEPAPV
jgi:hypothetical protein